MHVQGLVCDHDVNDCRLCIGLGGAAGNSKCKKGPNKRGPTKFHHFCYINYFKQKKKHTFVDAFNGVVCFQCKMPAKKRGA